MAKGTRRSACPAVALPLLFCNNRHAFLLAACIPWLVEGLAHKPETTEQPSTEMEMALICPAPSGGRQNAHTASAGLYQSPHQASWLPPHLGVLCTVPAPQGCGKNLRGDSSSRQHMGLHPSWSLQPRSAYPQNPSLPVWLPPSRADSPGNDFLRVSPVSMGTAPAPVSMATLPVAMVTLK